jgi:hypothetical protein
MNIISTGGFFKPAKPKRNLFTPTPKRVAMFARSAQRKRESDAFSAEQLRLNAINLELKAKAARQKEINYQTLFEKASANAKRYGANSLSGKSFARIQRERAMGLR